MNVIRWCRHTTSLIWEKKRKKVQIRRLLELGQEKINEIRDYSGYRCCINTELNSGNFLMNGAGKDNYLVDWEKAALW